MSEMIERVAKAIAGLTVEHLTRVNKANDQMRRYEVIKVGPDDPIVVDAFATYEAAIDAAIGLNRANLARFAIEAMRDPTPHMAAQWNGRAVIVDGKAYIPADSGLRWYTRMIDAALDE